jgi:eukaryotic-like serine/threonine-protein kinase
MTQPRLLGGRYELDGIVGRGGMAEVFRARDIRLDRIVGVKTLRSDLARDQTFQARFRREAQSAASLNHPSIVAVYDTGEDMVGGTPVPYIVMEFVDGRTLRDLLRDDRRLLPERAAEITDGVLRALDYSHRNGIVHRDIKPGNVMLTRSGEVKVMDFGIARAVSDSQMTMTQTAQVIGTAQYLSPEQARGERVDARSDLYSTGCLLYELLTGRPPFTGDSPVAIAYQHVKEEPVPPSRIDPEVPAWADAIVLKAMRKDPADRYQSAGEMRNDIQRALSGAPVAAPMQTATYGAGTRRLGAATQAIGRTSAIPPYEYGPEADGALERPDRHAGRWIVLALVIVLLAVGILAFKFLSGGTSGVGVPNLLNMTVAEAKSQLTKEGLKLGKVSKAVSASVAVNHVVSTSPQAGSQVNKGSAVALTISSGTGKVLVPNVIDGTIGEAERALSKVHLTWKFHQEPSPAGTASNIVLAQSPQPFTEVKPGTQVTLDVPLSSVAMPGLFDSGAAQAKQELEGAPYFLTVSEAPCTGSQLGTVQPGFVCGTSPAAGAQVEPHSAVTIFVEPNNSPSPQPSSPSPAPSTPSPAPSTPISPSPNPSSPSPGGP